MPATVISFHGYIVKDKSISYQPEFEFSHNLLIHGQNLYRVPLTDYGSSTELLKLPNYGRSTEILPTKGIKCSDLSNYETPWMRLHVH